MIVLATGKANAVRDGDRILATVQSGGNRIELSLSVNQALMLAHSMLREATALMAYTEDEVSGADVIGFPKRKRSRSK